MALDAAAKGTYGSVPPAIAEFITVAQSQHKQHLAGWNAVLSSAGKPPVTTPALTITPTEVAKLQAAKSIPEVATVALGVENAAAATYTLASSAVTGVSGVQVAASIAPVEAQHAAILSFVLGEYPVPQSFLTTTAAVQPSALTI